MRARARAGAVVYHLLKYEEGEEPQELPKPDSESDKLALAADFIEISPPDEPGRIPEKYPGWIIYKATKGSLQLYKPRQGMIDVP